MHDLATGHAGAYVNWGVIHVSVTNLVIIGLMVLAFILAVMLRLPHHHDSSRRDDRR